MKDSLSFEIVHGQRYQHHIGRPTVELLGIVHGQRGDTILALDQHQVLFLVSIF